MPKLKRLKISAVRLDGKNANDGTKRGREFISGSVKKYGLGRSILLDKDGNVMAGNKTLEAFKKQGGKELIVVGTRGDALVAVQREDLTINSKKGRSLAIADNRSTELDLNWNTSLLDSFGVDLGDFFSTKEFASLLGPSPDAPAEPRTSECVVVIQCTRAQLESIMGQLNEWQESGISIDVS